jgi:hypothetical protein
MAEVKLSNGAGVRVGPLKWQAYKALKVKVIDLVADKITKLFAANTQAGTYDTEYVASVVRELPGIVDSLNEEFIAGCLDKPVLLQDETLDVSDFDKLYAEALAVNPMEGILAREKNSPAGELASNLLSLLPAGVARKVSEAGGLSPNLNVFDPAGESAS